MIPSNHDSALPTKPSVAIIGAGACGITAAHAFLKDGSFGVIDVYEQRDGPGGVWNYTKKTLDCPIPSTDPFQELPEDVSAMYDGLGKLSRVETWEYIQANQYS